MKEDEQDPDFKEGISKHIVIYIFIGAIAFIVVSLFFIMIGYFESPEIITMCGDGTVFGACSLRQPYSCDNGVLIERASVCGCSRFSNMSGDFCTSKYITGELKRSFKYVIRGEEKELNFSVYGGMSDYLFNLPNTIRTNNNENISRKDFKMEGINEIEQRELLLPFVTEIQNEENDKIDQLRMAVSIVQNIPFGVSNKTIDFFGMNFPYSRYPYDVLYDNQGVCGEKSELLSFILRELGYEVVFFYNQKENHESIGIKCPEEFGFKKTGYCLIETTAPSIISDNGIIYVGGIVLKSKPELLLISEGANLSNNMYEYEDAKIWKELRDEINEKGELNIFKIRKMNKLIKKYGLDGEYNI